MSQSYRRSELRKNAHADKSNNGVVGSRGRKIPTTPSTKESEPNMINAIFTGAKLINRSRIAIKPQKFVTFAQI